MPRDADFMLTPEERRLRDRKRRWVWIIIVAAVVALGIAAVAARPTRNAIKGWQARRQAEKAFALVEQEKWKEAQEAAIAAYQLRSTEPQALRALARFFSRLRQPQALEFWDKLKQRQPLTPADLREQAAVALALGDKVRAEAAVAALTAATTPAAADWLLAAQLELLNGAPAKALELASKVFAKAEATPREQLQATLLQLQASRTGKADADTRNQREAWERIEKLASRDDVVGLEALLILAQRQLAGGTSAVALQESIAAPESPGGTTGTTDGATAGKSDGTATVPPDLSERLAAHPLAKAPQKLLALDLLLSANPARRSELIDRAVSDWSDGDGSALVALATWLNGKGEFQRHLDTIPLETALQSQDLFLQHVDALGALSRWDDVRKLLEAERFPLDPVIRQMYLARCNLQLGHKTAAENSWRRALEAAGGDVRKLMMLAEYAEKNGIRDTAEAAYAQTTSIAPKLRPAWAGRLRTAYATRDTKRIHAVLSEMLNLWPDDPAIQNDEAYTRLLLLGGKASEVGSQTSEGSDQKSEVGSQRSEAESPANNQQSEFRSQVTAGASPPANDQRTTRDAERDEEIAGIERLAQRLVEANPASLPHRTLLALARLQQGRPAEALKVYEGIQAAANAFTPSAVVVHAAVLAANNQAAQARAEAAQVPAERLLPEEEAMTANLRE